MLPFLWPSCYSKTRLPSCALGTSFYTVSEGSDLMTYISDNYTSYSAPSCLIIITVKMADTFASVCFVRKSLLAMSIESLKAELMSGCISLFIL